MAPRALTEQEKTVQREKILAAARELVLQLGIKKVSIEDIVRAAGVGKATFYSYFENKEALLIQLVWALYQKFVAQVRQIIKDSPKKSLRRNVGVLIRTLVMKREALFFFNNHRELEELTAALSISEIRNFNQMEYRAFESLILDAELDPQIVKPDVVHNCTHAIYFSASNEAMMPEHLDETITVLVDGLLTYLFGAEAANGKE